MKLTKIFGLIVLAMLICIACKNSAKSEKSENKTTTYDSIEEISGHYYEKGVGDYPLKLVRANSKIGFICEIKEIFPCIFDSVVEAKSDNRGVYFVDSYNGNYYAKVKQNGKWGLIDKDNNIVINFEYDGIKFTSTGLDDWHYFYEGRISVKKGKFWSVVDKNGLNHIPFEYDDVEIWSEGKVCVKKNGKWGLVDSLGKQLVPIEHKYAMDAGNFHY